MLSPHYDNNSIALAECATKAHSALQLMETFGQLPCRVGRPARSGSIYGLPPAMALDVASSYLLNKARLSLAQHEMEKMQNKGKPTNLVDQLADLLMKGDEDFDGQL